MQPAGEIRRPPGRPRAFDIDDALDKAVELFWLKGYAATSVENLTNVMGIRPPSFYKAFVDKESLFLQCVERYANTVAEGIRSTLKAPDVSTAVESFLVAAANAYASHDAPSGCLLIFGLGGAFDDVPLAKSMYSAAIELMVRAVERRLEAAKKAGQLPKHFPSRDRATLATDLLLAIAVKARGGAPLRQLEKEARERSILILN